MSETPVPNRLVEVPKSLYEYLDRAWAGEEEYEHFRIKKVLAIAYRCGYTDGYRDGHDDAKSGHDEGVWAHVASGRA